MDIILHNPAKTTIAKALNVLLGFVVIFIWMLIVTKITNTKYDPGQFYIPILPMSEKYAFFIMCIFAPLWEELVFRKAILTHAKNQGINQVFPMMIISSFIFGWLHQQGQESIMRQGVMGFIFACVYVKNSFSYASSWALHLMWNIFAFFLADKIF